VWRGPGGRVLVRGGTRAGEQRHDRALSRRHGGPRAAQQRPLAGRARMARPTRT
jgi:hypothetical protein